MASRQQNGNAEPGPSKKRRLPGACDMCKKRKIRCDSGEKANGQCTNCTNSGIECTHVELTKNLGSAKGYVESLESRLEKMELLLKQLLPGVDINSELEADPAEAASKEEETLPRNDLDQMAFKLEKLSLETPYSRYYGKSSDLYLVETALKHKENHTGQEVPVITSKHKTPVWEPEWTHAFEETLPEYNFPEDDLMHNLVDLYFDKYNVFLPLLHRPTFERSVKQGEHLHDHSFGAVLLLVCALGARFSYDPRVFEDGPQSAGWQYIRQVPISRVPRGKTGLYDIQAYALAVPWLKSCTYSYASWTLLGLGIRLAQDVGVHNPRIQRSPNAEDELWKRAFFILLYYERTMGSFMGRSPILHDDETNLEPSIIVDDEFWECTDPKMNFKQPAGKPSSIAFFVHLMKLTDILSYAQRTVYSLRKPNPITGKPTIQNEQQLIADLDSAMNNWLDSVPDFLKWDPKRSKDLFFQQSATLWISFYALQTFIHKPFIPTPQRPSSLSFPSLTICTTASRALSHIARVLQANNMVIPMSHAVTCFFIAGVVLLLNTWTGKRSGVTGNLDRDRSDVQAIMDLMRFYETSWSHAGLLCDLLEELAKVSRVPVYGQKRRRSAENLREEAKGSSRSSIKDRTFAGSRRASKANGSSGSSSSSASSVGTSSPEMPTSGPPSGLSSMSSFNFSPDLPGLIGDFSTPSSSSSGNSPPYVPQSYPYLPDLGTNASPEFPATTSNTYSQQAELDTLLASLPAMSDPAMSLWSSTPWGTEMQDWAPYLSSFGQVDQSTPQVYSTENDMSNVHQLW
ncbi:Gypsy retrotransposon integrase-like protein 1 [Marasmius tenuissimus]|nr:Gypsy retrotransposon integrase-like protein 1 [Marasmius tenuissimus]